MSVGEVMKATGLTHGAFYADFESKHELQKATVAYGQGLTASRNHTYGATKSGRKAYADRYLSPRHRDNLGNGCTMAALAQDVARSTPELKEVFEQGFEKILAEGGQERKETS